MGNGSDGIKMKTMKSLQVYTPDEENAFLGDSVIYLKCSDGNDWYLSQKDFQPDSVKIAFNGDGIICAMSADISRLWPVGLSVTEIDASEVPGGAEPDGTWIFDGSKIYPDAVAIATRMKSSLLSNVNQKISPLQDLLDVDEATNGDKEKLTEWKKYRVLLNKIDVTAPDITWPEIPA